MTRQAEDLPAKPLPKKGLPHVLAAATYSLGGFRRLLGETAFRHEIGACFGVFGLFAVVGVPAWHYAAQAVLFLILIAIEALNTAVEVLVDEISPGYAEFARYAKDLGSFAVFCLLFANGIHAAGAIFLT